MEKKNEKIKVTSYDLRNLPLTEYYGNLPTATRKVVVAPKDELLEEIAEISGRLPSTVRTWCLGQNTPPPYIKEKIAKHFGTSVETLFPEL